MTDERIDGAETPADTSGEGHRTLLVAFSMPPSHE